MKQQPIKKWREDKETATGRRRGGEAARWRTEGGCREELFRSVGHETSLRINALRQKGWQAGGEEKLMMEKRNAMRQLKASSQQIAEV